MKKLSILFSMIIVALVWSCDEKDNLEPVGNWELTAPTLSAPSENATLTLNEAAPSTNTKFEWQGATASNRFGVSYTMMLFPKESTTLDNPILTVEPGNSGKNLFVEVSAEDLDYALWAACYPAGATAALKWVVVAKSIEKTSQDSQPISIIRFETEYMPSTLFVTGEATEAGAGVGDAMAMRAQKDAEGNGTGLFDIYTTLTEGKSYYLTDQTSSMGRMMGGENGAISCGTTFVAPATGQYRITANLNDNTYSLLKIEKWSLVGDGVEGGWGGDVPLEYKGNGVWQSDIEFYKPYEGAGFIFRANGEWGYLLKRIKGTATPNNKGGDVFLESEAGNAGIEVEDIPTTEGLHTVTLTLGADGYTYSLVPVVSNEPVETIIGKSNNPTADAVSGNFVIGEYETPNTLFLLSGGEVVAEFVKDGDVFNSAIFVALEAAKTYTLNDKEDGSGTTYNENGDGTISVNHDQAYQINVDFAEGKLLWKHYNMKLFHWNNDGGWDQRQEIPMTYIHPYKYEATGSLSAGFDSKFNSPWDVQFGTTATALTGTMTNGGDNFKGITSSGTYKATITVSEDYSTAEYAFVKQ